MGFDCRYRDITIRGVVYASVADAARAVGVSRATVYVAIRKGRLDTVGLGAARPVTVDGVTYASRVAAAQALGLRDSSTVAKAINKGRLDFLGKGRGRRERMPVKIGATVYPHVDAAAAALNVTRRAVFAALQAGNPDRLLRGRRGNGGQGRAIVIGGVAFSSMAAASRALGFSPSYVAQALRARRQSAMDRIVAAAMAYAERRDRRAA